MSQISRPFQIALLAMVVLAGVWFFALHGHSSSSGSSSSASTPTTTPAAAPSAASEEKAAGTATPVYKGAAPGVQGLSRAIANAHKAVATSQQNAKQLEEKSNQASRSATGAPQTTSTAAATPQPAATTPVKTQTAPTPAATPAKTAAPSATAALSPTGQLLVEQELKQGKTVAIMFWNPKGAVDQTVRGELQAFARSQGGALAVNYASAQQVGSFGTITRSIQVYSTPTILLVNKKGQTSTVIGLTDTFALKQAIQEMQHP